MNHEAEIQARERLTLLWLDAEPVVRAYVGAVVRGFHDAQDVTQQVALTVARRFDGYDDSRPFVAWAPWLAKSRIVDHCRKQGRERLVFSETLISTGGGPRGAATARRQAVLERCVEKLPEKSRRMLNLRYADETSMEEMVAAQASTPGCGRFVPGSGQSACSRSSPHTFGPGLNRPKGVAIMAVLHHHGPHRLTDDP